MKCIETDVYNAFAHILEEPLYQSCLNSPLNGLSAATKDFPPNEYAIAGSPITMGGVPAMEGYISPEHGVFTLLALVNGLQLVGITNAPEIGTSNHTANLLYGATLNPFDASLTAGGSSGGAAVAVRTGLIDIGFGGDGGGSLRSPAAMNGLIGHLVSAGILQKVRDSVYDFGQPGAVTRDVMQLALTLNMMRAHSTSVDFTEYLKPEKTQPELVYAVMGSLSLHEDMHPANVDALNILDAAMSELGHRRHPDSGRLPLPFADNHSLETSRAYMRAVGTAAAGSMRQIRDLSGTDPKPWRNGVSWGNWAGACIEPVAIRNQIADQQTVSESGERFQEYMDRHGIDVIIAPTITTSEGPFAKPEHLLRGFNLFLVSALALSGISRRVDIMKLAAKKAFPYSHAPENIWGVPSTSLPVHYARSPSDRLAPVGAKVIGRRGSDAVSLALAQQVSDVLGGFESMAQRALDANGSQHWLRD